MESCGAIGEHHTRNLEAIFAVETLLLWKNKIVFFAVEGLLLCGICEHHKSHQKSAGNFLWRTFLWGVIFFYWGNLGCERSATQNGSNFAEWRRLWGGGRWNGIEWRQMSQCSRRVIYKWWTDHIYVLLFSMEYMYIWALNGLKCCCAMGNTYVFVFEMGNTYVFVFKK